MKANPATYQKVRSLIIDPMVRHYGLKPLDDHQVEVFVEDLGAFSEQALADAWLEVRRTSLTRPNVAHFRRHLPAETKPTSSVSSPRDRGEFFCRHDAALAERCMRSPIGQRALAEGVGLSVWIDAWRDGRSDFSERDVDRWKAAQRDTADRLASASARPSPFTDSLIRTFAAMQEREKQLHARYFRPAA